LVFLFHRYAAARVPGHYFLAVPDLFEASQSSPGDRLDAPIFRSGAPAYFFDCTTAGFTP
jgi:hypothetical protein